MRLGSKRTPPDKGAWPLAIRGLVRTDLTEDLKKFDVRTPILLD
jgi:hypothetical protein